MPIDCAEHPTFPGNRIICPGDPFSVAHPGERDTNLPVGVLSSSLALNAPFWLQGRGTLGGHPWPCGFAVPSEGRDLHPSAFGEPRPPITLLGTALQLSSPDPLISCNTETVLKPLQRGLSLPPHTPPALATFPVTLIRALSINQAEMKASWGYITTPWKGMKGPL